MSCSSSKVSSNSLECLALIKYKQILFGQTSAVLRHKGFYMPLVLSYVWGESVFRVKEHIVPSY